MKAATLAQIKKELKMRSPDEIEALCLRLGRFKKENKELLTYLLFEADDEEGYVEHIKEYIDELFDGITNTNFYYLKKSVRKILKETKKCIRYSNSKETEVALLLHFCTRLISFKPSIKRNTTLINLYERQLDLADKKIKGLHEDLQLDYVNELEELR
ncbi:hypothetical protein ULMS_15700 [Patiriisocius marinistellae]|uniref:Uncharacterized protein n=1 Tax=Patiriisocius marinistellae TaxID=2494560 RepID=A0A5J4FXZ6_9FLAO|nr:hypothetical protein [Patiriisocius marinistellae]GEQ86062.1 hypothetical protein ULMS_15700 [Patiriisocius marinistellae]